MEQLLERNLLSRKNLSVLEEIKKLVKFSLHSDKIRHSSTMIIVILGNICIGNCTLDNNLWLTVVEELIRDIAVSRQLSKTILVNENIPGSYLARREAIGE